MFYLETIQSSTSLLSYVIFKLCPLHSRVGRENLILQLNSALHFPSNSLEWFLTLPECVSSGGTQYRALPRYQSAEILNTSYAFTVITTRSTCIFIFFSKFVRIRQNWHFTLNILKLLDAVEFVVSPSLSPIPHLIPRSPKTKSVEFRDSKSKRLTSYMSPAFEPAINIIF